MSPPPWNKGLKTGRDSRAEYHFKPGHTLLSRPIGSERICKKDGYLKRKIAEPRTWKLVHHIIWEEANGPIPKGMAVVFNPGGDKLKPRLEDLEMIPRGELMRRNTVHRYPENVKTIIRAVAILKRSITRKVNGRKEKTEY